MSQTTCILVLLLIAACANGRIPHHRRCPGGLRPGASCKVDSDCPLLEPYCNSNEQRCFYGVCCSPCTKHWYKFTLLKKTSVELIGQCLLLRPKSTNIFIGIDLNCLKCNDQK
uniref:WAP domain-containing protein n=1 Tax=Syphacia muris TaxID=451379 RepID=A0A0N5AI21_9BILA